jgi:LDH2 family malate/lactate/ureidoglycolate dehydrogenase
VADLSPKESGLLDGQVFVAAEEARAFTRSLLGRFQVPDADANTVAECLVRADLRGVDTHGIRRLPVYVDRLRRGLINPSPLLEPEPVARAAAALDGRNGFGFVVATRAMSEAMSIAGDCGVGIVSVKRSTHFGMAAAYVLQAVERGFMAIVFTNASPGLAPWGGRTPLLGTSPLAAGAPAGTSIPFILDMSPAVAARGKIRKALQLGQRLPPTWALDAQGKPTTDPQAALDGVLQPIGGPKGSGLAIMMDIFGGLISGAAYAGDVGDMYKVLDRPQNVGHFFLAMRPDLFIPLDDYRQRMESLVERIHSSSPAEGFGEVLIPGEIESREERLRTQTGIPFSASQLHELRSLGLEVGVERLLPTNG